MYHSRISNVSTQTQSVAIINVNSLTNLNNVFLIQKNWFLIRLRNENVTKNFVPTNIGQFPDLNENDLPAVDIAKTTLKKLLDNVEETSKHRQDQKKKRKKLLTEVERLKRRKDNYSILNGCSPQRVAQKTVQNYFKQKTEPNSRI